MSFASKYNKQAVYFDVDTDGFEFCRFRELKVGTEYKLLGVFLKDGKFGTYPIFIVEGWLVSGTPSMADTVKMILNDPEAVNDIKAGKVGIKVRTYDNDFGKQYAVDYVDL